MAALSKTFVPTLYRMITVFCLYVNKYGYRLEQVVGAENYAQIEAACLIFDDLKIALYPFVEPAD